MARPCPLLTSLVVLAAATGCTVYAPMQPTMPLLAQRGQLEAGANLQPTGRLEATAAYSPLSRLVLTGGLTGAPRLGGQNFLITRQAELGAGLHQRLGPNWLLSGLGGYGQAYCRRGFREFLGGYYEYEAHYGKYFGQVGLAHSSPRGTVGLVYRLAKVDFNYLADSQDGPLPLPGMLRHELTYFVRVDVAQRWKTTVAAGFSTSSTKELETDYHNPTYSQLVFHANHALRPALFFSVGVVYQPWQAAR